MRFIKATSQERTFSLIGITHAVMSATLYLSIIGSCARRASTRVGIRARTSRNSKQGVSVRASTRAWQLKRCDWSFLPAGDEASEFVRGWEQSSETRYIWQTESETLVMRNSMGWKINKEFGDGGSIWGKPDSKRVYAWMLGVIEQTARLTDT